MKMRNQLIPATGVEAVCLAYAGETTGAAIAVAGGVIWLHLHAIEIKLNKLLDERGIIVWDADLDK